MHNTRWNVLSIAAPLLTVALSVLCATGAAAQGAGTFVEEDSNLGRGFDATKAFDAGDVDTVNTFNGNLALSIPIGLEYPEGGGMTFGLSLRYNSSVWDFKTFGQGDVDFEADVPEPDDCATFSQSWPSLSFNAGMGWQLSLGRLYEAGPTETNKDRQDDDGVAINSDQPMVYIGPDGARHEFFQTLHEAEPALGGVLPYYSRDGSYLRLRCADPSGSGSVGGCTQLEVDSPDGGRRVFERDPRVKGSYAWRVVKIEDAFGNYVQVDDYDDPPGPDKTILADHTWTLSDSQGRQYTIGWKAPTVIPESELGERAFGREVVDRIVVPGAGVLNETTSEVESRTLEYRFDYEDVRIDRACRDNYPWGKTLARPHRYPLLPGHVRDPRESQIWVRRLTTIELPDGTEYGLQYDDGGQSGPGCTAGLLGRVDLPTGGATTWRYGSYEFPTLQDCPIPNVGWTESQICSNDFTPGTLSVGVVERKQLNSDGTELGTWTYQHTLELEDGVGTPTCGDLRVLRTTVTNPLGHKTEHYYSGYVQGDDDQVLGWKRTEYGLPFTRTDSIQSGGDRLFLSSRTLDCTGGPCAEARRTYVRYELDPTSTAFCSDGGPTALYCQATNARVVARRVVYADSDIPEGEHFVETESSDFDGLGHYRTVDTTAGNLPGSGGRTAFTDYNPDSGTLVVDHDAGTATGFTAPVRWLLETYDETRVTEGSLTERQQADFDPDTGFLRRVRAFKNTEGSPPSTSAEDVITVFTPDAQGNEVRRERHGGAFDHVPTSTALANLNLGPPEYRVDKTWDAGVLATSRWVDPVDPTATLSIVDHRVIDPGSGRVLRAADPAGLVTTSVYDALGRVTAIEPTDDAPTRIEYDLAARPVTVRMGRGAHVGADTLSEPEQQYLYDGFGRPVTQRERLPGSAWSEQITGYYGDGSVAWVTDRHLLSTTVTDCSDAPAGTPARGCTRNRKLDAFGRPTVVLAPDSGKREITYYGMRKTLTKERQVATSALGTASGTAQRIELRDFAGRIVEVYEDSKNDGSLVKSTYTYDAGGRLTTAKAGGAGQAKRLFFYDGRGFLGSERHPEMATIDADGLHSVEWGDYDSLGNPGRRTDGDSDRAYDYDFAGRLIRVRDLLGGGPPVAEYFYGRKNFPDGRGGTSWSLGKLVQSRRVNRFSARRPVTITETFEHAGPEGRLSRSSLRSFQENGEDVRFTQELDYDEFGDLDQITYPGCDGPSYCGPAIAPRMVDRSFERQRLRSVRDGGDDSLVYATSLSYDANGMTTEIRHGNGVTDTIAADPHGIARPNAISFAGPFGLWSSGTYFYDGRGDIFAIGMDYYRYDPVGRLLEGTVFAGAKQQNLSYDTFGNITASSTTDRGAYGSPVDPATNRLAEAGIAYTAAGKLSQFRGLTVAYGPLERPAELAGQGVNVDWAYDAAGERVAAFDQLDGEETWTVRDPQNRVLRHYHASVAGAGDPAWQVQDYVYQGGRLLATVDDGQVRHLHPDHLGTPRLVTDGQGGEVSRHTYYPFGEEVFPGSGVDQTVRRRDETLRFAGQERDLNGESAADPAVDDLDYVHARYYSPFYGRFLSVDQKSGSPSDPQSWNRYAYVLGNPVRLVDPTGEIVEGFFNEYALFGFKLTVGYISEVDWENGDGFWDPETDSGFFVSVGHPKPTEGRVGIGGGVAGGAFFGTGNIESFEGRGVSGGSGFVLSVGGSANPETGDAVIYAGLGASFHPHVSDTNTSVLSMKDLFPGLFDGAGPRITFTDSITVRDTPLKILDPPGVCSGPGVRCIQRIPIDPLDDIEEIDK